MREINSVIIHCTATRPSMDIGVAEVDEMHRRRGFNWSKTAEFGHVGYHAVIRRDGVLEDGRPEWAIGAHAKGWNRHSLGVALVGGVREDDVNAPEDNFTPQQFDRLERYLRYAIDRFGPVEIIGHREIAYRPKACPSFDVDPWLAARGFSEMAEAA